MTPTPTPRDFIDTSVLVAGLIDWNAATEPAAARRLLDRVSSATDAESRPFTSWHCCLEFLSVTTRLPEEYRLSIDQAVAQLEHNVLRRFEVVHLPVENRTAWLSTLMSDRIAGGRIYDSEIAETARHTGAAAVITENRRHFVTLLRHGIRVLTAAERLQVP